MSIQCSNCGAVAEVVREDYAFTESCLNDVVLQNIEVVKCPRCGEREPIVPRMEDVMRSLAITVALQPGRLDGDQVRFLRTYLGYGTEDFARLLHAAPGTLARWEAGNEAIGSQSDLLVRVFLLTETGEAGTVRDALDRLRTTDLLEAGKRAQIRIAPESVGRQHA